MNAKRKKIRKDRLATLLVLCTVVTTIIGFGVQKTSGILFHDPCEIYKAYETKREDYGDIQQVSREHENEAFVSFTYPVYEEGELNSLVKAYGKKTVPAAGKTKRRITSVDYDGSLLLDRYMNLALHRHICNADGMQTHIETTRMPYDKRQKKQLVLKDVLRCEYPALVKRLAGKRGRRKDIKCGTSALSMTKTSLRTYLDKKHTVSIPYKEYRKYTRLKDSHIPSLYQEDIAVVRAQSEVDPKKRMIVFTSDDGPSTYTSEVMDIPERYGGRATFFMLGQNVKANHDTVKEMYNRDFELGNHSWDHSMDLATSKEGYMFVSQVTENVYRAQDATYAVCGTEPQYFYLPYGTVNNNVLKGNRSDYTFRDINTRD